MSRGRPPHQFIPVPKHGTAARYKHAKFPCRDCAACREAWRLSKKLYRRRRRIDQMEEAFQLRKEGRYAESEAILASIRKKS